MTALSPHVIADLLQAEWYHNTLRAWITSAASAVGIFVGLVALRGLVISRAGSLAARTPNRFDDMLVGVLRETRQWVLLAFSIYTAAQYLSLPNRIERFMHPTAKLILLWQVGLWGSAAVTFWIRHYMERRTDSNDRASVTMISAIGVGGKVILWVLITVTALQSVFGIAITPVLTTLGVGGVAVALAVQNILGDLLAALAIVFDQPFDVGDYIVVGDVSGNVERIGLKTTRVRSISGEQVILGNADLLKSRLRNFRRLYQRRVLFNIDVMIDTPTEKLERLPGTIQEIIQAQSPVKFDRSHVLGLTDSAVRIESVYYVLDPEYSVHMNIQQAVQLEIFRRLAAENIRIAYPSRTIFVEQGAERIL